MNVYLLAGAVVAFLLSFLLLRAAFVQKWICVLGRIVYTNLSGVLMVVAAILLHAAIHVDVTLIVAGTIVVWLATLDLVLYLYRDTLRYNVRLQARAESRRQEMRRAEAS